MTALANHSPLLVSTKQVQKASYEFIISNSKEFHDRESTETMPARGVILGVMGGAALWGMIIWAVSKMW